MPCDEPNLCSSPNTVDGRSFRSFITVNKQMPGPTLIMNENARVIVDVTNNLRSQVTSIHWHGMHQKNTPWMDGVGYITQCPIEPGASFRYIFEATPSGTFWYHSHTGPQRSNGLFGALIVRELALPKGLPVFEDDPGRHAITLLDWQRESSLDLFIQIHRLSLGFMYYLNKIVDEVPTRESPRFVPGCSVDGAGLGGIPYWSGIVNGFGKHKDVTFANSRIKAFYVERGNRRVLRFSTCT